MYTILYTFHPDLSMVLRPYNTERTQLYFAGKLILSIIYKKNEILTGNRVVFDKNLSLHGAAGRKIVSAPPHPIGNMPTRHSLYSGCGKCLFRCLLNPSLTGGRTPRFCPPAAVNCALFSLLKFEFSVNFRLFPTNKAVQMLCQPALRPAPSMGAHLSANGGNSLSFFLFITSSAHLLFNIYSSSSHYYTELSVENCIFSGYAV